MQTLRTTRERILQTLLANPHSTINDIAGAVSINPISVRHHIINLLADGSIEVAEERHGVGRPRLVYSLSERGLEKFPTRYVSLTNRLLDQIKETLPEQQVSRIFSQLADGMASTYAEKAQKMTLDQRLQYVREILAQEGFTIEWERSNGMIKIHEITCPYLQVGQSHPEVCTVDQTIISTILKIPAEKITCVLSGDAHCTYVIPDLSLSENK
jgi:DeoR family transcriptional regulator, suf operon transcriptional repressor